MKQSTQTLMLLLTVSLLSSCSLMQTKVDSNTTNYAKGFEFKYPKTGEWIQGQSGPGSRMIGKEPGSDGSSVVATVRYGSIGVTATEMAELQKTGKLKAHSVSEIIASFKTNIENDAKQGRVKDIKTTFEEKKSDKGSCLLFSQTGKDGGTSPMSNDGKWCFNPKTYSYIMMNMSARVPEGARLPDLTTEKNEFFNSLVFADQ